MILQTYQPDHYAIRAAGSHDYQAFSQEELRHRAELGYPPFKRLVRMVYRDVNAARAEREAKRMAGALTNLIRENERKLDLVGPAPCFFRRIRGRYRWQIVLRGENPASILPEEQPQGWAIDVDPVNLL